jgi:hypothetical protein
VIASDDVEGLRQHLFATGEPDFNQRVRTVPADGDVFGTSIVDGRELSIIAAAEFGALRCAQFLRASGAEVGAVEVKAAFRGGTAELMRLIWGAFPHANPLELALAAVKSWNAAGLRWLLEHKIGGLSEVDLVRLFEAACSSGSYSCGSSVLRFSGPAASYLRGLRRVGVVGSVLCGGLASRGPSRKISFIPEQSIAAGYAEQVREWLTGTTEMKLIARRGGGRGGSVNAFIAAAKGRAKTLTFVETENGRSICGGYLDVAWVEGGFASDPERRSFVFTLKNHFGVPPTRFAQKRDGCAASMIRNVDVVFGTREGFMISRVAWQLSTGLTYEAPAQGAALFDGDGGGLFRLGQWELWEVR